MVLQEIQQGAKLSTTLYKCYNNLILDSILKSGLGACIGDIQVPAPTCADDIAVLKNSSNISTLQFADNDINITNETKHLGIKRNEQNRAKISERIRTGRATIYSLLGAGLHVRRRFSPMVAYKLWITYTVPKSIYGLEVMNLHAKERDMLELAERKSSDKFKGFQIIQQIRLSIIPWSLETVHVVVQKHGDTLLVLMVLVPTTTRPKSFLSGIANYGIPLRVRSEQGLKNMSIVDYMFNQRVERDMITDRITHNQRLERI
ncbi:unnamed protein product [Mytilus edulis]|uniref:Integrase core domain-containing protein n=1 Tax=Mytilus edulis TaxID=6550 RepID=A0A8S3V668_MYTED|nr:unnamed protein product [Mytilus edulis]